jgi:hypothetical protein
MAAHHPIAPAYVDQRPLAPVSGLSLRSGGLVSAVLHALWCLVFGVLSPVCRQRAANVNLIGRKAARVVPTNKPTTTWRPGRNVDPLALTSRSMLFCHESFTPSGAIAASMQIADQRAPVGERTNRMPTGCVRLQNRAAGRMNVSESCVAQPAWTWLGLGTILVNSPLRRSNWRVGVPRILECETPWGELAGGGALGLRNRNQRTHAEIQLLDDGTAR